MHFVCVCISHFKITNVASGEAQKKKRRFITIVCLDMRPERCTALALKAFFISSKAVSKNGLSLSTINLESAINYVCLVPNWTRVSAERI